MRISREKDRIRLKLNVLEAQIFEQVLRTIVRDYKIDPAQLDPKAASAWYSTRGCKTSNMSEEETQEWIESLHHLKLSQVSRLEEWAARLAARQVPEMPLEFSFSEATALITALNDYRLSAAARNAIGQGAMALHDIRKLKELSPSQQNALCEIDFLGLVIERLLRYTAPEASRWMEPE